MALLDRIATIFFDSKAARAKAMIHSIAVENAFIAFTMAQVPLADQAALITNEGTMVYRLAKLHNVRIDRASAVVLVETVIASLGGPMIATAGANQIVKYFPGYSNASNAAVAYTLTEIIGLTCNKWFIEGSWFQKT